MFKLFVFAVILAFAASAPAPAPKPGLIAPIAPLSYSAPISYYNPIAYGYNTQTYGSYAPSYYYSNLGGGLNYYI